MVWELNQLGGLTEKIHLPERNRLANGNLLNIFQKQLENWKPIRQFQNTG